LLPLAPTAILVGLSPPSAARGYLGICPPPTRSSGTCFSPSPSGFIGSRELLVEHLLSRQQQPAPTLGLALGR
jgi:hypothetical protein